MKQHKNVTIKDMPLDLWWRMKQAATVRRVSLTQFTIKLMDEALAALEKEEKR